MKTTNGNEQKTTETAHDLVASYEGTKTRRQARYAERKTVETRSFNLRMEIVRASSDEHGGATTAAKLEYELLMESEMAVGFIDQAMDSLENLRHEMIAIATGQRKHQVEHAPDTEEISRRVGGVGALLKAVAMIAAAPKEEEGR